MLAIVLLKMFSDSIILISNKSAWSEMSTAIKIICDKILTLTYQFCHSLHHLIIISVEIRLNSVEIFNKLVSVIN